MKFLSQFVELYIPAANLLLVLTTLLSVFILLKAAFTNAWSKVDLKIRKNLFVLENDMWAIE